VKDIALFYYSQVSLAYSAGCTSNWFSGSRNWDCECRIFENSVLMNHQSILSEISTSISVLAALDLDRCCLKLWPVASRKAALVLEFAYLWCSTDYLEWPTIWALFQQHTPYSRLSVTLYLEPESIKDDCNNLYAERLA